MNGFVWKVSVGDIYLGTAPMDVYSRWDLIKKSVDEGIIPSDYNLIDVNFEMIKNEERTN